MNRCCNPFKHRLFFTASAPQLFRIVCLLLAFTGIARSGSAYKPTGDVIQRDAAPDTYLDSLYTYAYFKHRLHLCDQKFRIPKQIRRRLFASAALADTLAARAAASRLGSYRYLIEWVKSPERPESDFTGVAPDTGPGICDLSDTLGYTAFQKQVTAWRVLAATAKRENRYDLYRTYSDSAIRLTPHFLSGLYEAKRQAIIRRDTSGYIALFSADPYLNDSDRIRSDTGWSLARAPADKDFVRHCIAIRGRSETRPRSREPLELRLLVNRYAELHDKVSQVLFPARNPIAIWLLPHKARIRSIDLEIVMECYTVLPDLLGRQLAKDTSFSCRSGNDVGYLMLHLLQFNAYGMICPKALFERNFRFLECLVYNRMLDIEIYAEYYDMYLTAVLHEKPRYGSGTRIRGNDMDDYIENTATTRDNRMARNMIPELE